MEKERFGHLPNVKYVVKMNIGLAKKSAHFQFILEILIYRLLLHGHGMIAVQ